MQRTKDDFLDEREVNFDAEMGGLEKRMREQEQRIMSSLPPEERPVTGLPVIDLNSLKPEQQTTQMQFDSSIETVDLTSMLIADKLVNAILAGTLDPLVFMVKKKLLEDALIIAAKNPDVKQMAANEVSKYGKEGAKLLGATITAGSRKKYNYAEDPVWASLEEQARPITDLMKAQEKLVQAAVKQGKSFEEVDKETGEVKMLAKCVAAPATDYVAVTFKKK